MPIKRVCCYFSILICIFFTGSPVSAIDSKLSNRVKIKADSLRYTERNRKAVASSNVVLTFQDVTLNANRVVMDIDAETASGNGNVVIRKQGQVMYANKFWVDLNANTVSLYQPRAVIRSDATGNVYVRAAEMTDNGSVRTGKEGVFTTCDLDDPHYFLKAGNFTHYPDKRIVGHNVWVYSPIWFVPFGFWTPVYFYELGKRRLILAPPQIGQNAIVGMFVQNTLDYYYGENKNGQIYVDYFEAKGWGLGVKNHYTLNSGDGFVKIYGANEQDTGQKSHAIEWDQSLRLTPKWTLGHTYRTTDMFRLTSRARRNEELKNVRLTYDDFGNTYRLKIDDFSDRFQSVDQFNVDYAHTLHDQPATTFHYDKYDFFGTGALNETYLLKQDLRVAQYWTINNAVTYRTNRSSQNEPLDLYLNPITTVGRNTRYGKLTIVMDATLDPDAKTVTRDMSLNFVEKMPELTFAMNPVEKTYGKAVMSWGSTWLSGRYHEVKSTSLSLRDKTFEKYGTLQTLQMKINTLPLGFNTHFLWNYDQFLYSPGDALYRLNQTYSLNHDLHPTPNRLGMANQTTYTSQDSFGNSPLVFDTLNAAKTARVSHTVAFYVDTRSRYFLDFTQGYNYVTQKREDFIVNLGLNPHSRFSLNANGGFRYSENRSVPLDRFYYLNTNVRYQPSEKTTLSGNLSYDFNTGEIRQLTNTYRWEIGNRWQTHWWIDTRFLYDTQLRHYKLDQLQIRKDLHCRELMFSYNEPLREYKITLVINAFPDDKVGVSGRNNEPFRFEGQSFNDNAKDRF